MEFSPILTQLWPLDLGQTQPGFLRGTRPASREFARPSSRNDAERRIHGCALLARARAEKGPARVPAETSPHLTPSASNPHSSWRSRRKPLKSVRRARALRRQAHMASSRALPRLDMCNLERKAMAAAKGQRAAGAALQRCQSSTGDLPFVTTPGPTCASSATAARAEAAPRRCQRGAPAALKASGRCRRRASAGAS